MIEVLGMKILESAVGAAVAILQKAVERKNVKLLADQAIAEENDRSKAHANRLAATVVGSSRSLAEAIAVHLETTKKWCASIKFEDMQYRKSVLAVYVELDTYLMPLANHMAREERLTVQPLLKELARPSGHAAILGNPGSGKTTSLQKICADYFVCRKALGIYNFPLLIRLRELSIDEFDPLYSMIGRLLKIRLDLQLPDHMKKDEEAHLSDLRVETLNALLDDLNIVILLDGFDEIPSDGCKERVIRDIERLSTHLQRSKVIVTSRGREFRYRLSNIEKFEIAPLTRHQIEDFTSRWLTSTEQASDFITKLFDSPFADTAIRPLTVAHLLAIYERIRDIPKKPKDVYRKIVHLLLEEWDHQRGIVRHSSYAGFDPYRKLEFLAHVAYVLTTQVRALVFSEQDLQGVYQSIYRQYRLPASEADSVIGELESHSGLIISSGYRIFEFAHKSLHEFLAAEYIIKLPTVRSCVQVLNQLPNEMAIATSLSSRPCIYLTELTLSVLGTGGLSRQWFSIFLSRLILEKVDLEPEDVTESGVAALVLLGLSDYQSAAHELLRPLVPAKPAALLSKYYSFLQREGEYQCFMKVSDFDDFELPTALKIPSPVLDV